HGLAARFLLHDDLGEDGVGDVLAGLGVDDFELALLADHLGQPFQRYVAGAFRVIEAAVRIFLDDRDVVAGSLGRHENSPCASGLGSITKACRTATQAEAAPSVPLYAAQRNRSATGAHGGGAGGPPEVSGGRAAAAPGASAGARRNRRGDAARLWRRGRAGGAGPVAHQPA